MVVGDERCEHGLLAVVVVPDGGGEGEQSLQDATEHSLRAVTATGRSGSRNAARHDKGVDRIRHAGIATGGPTVGQQTRTHPSSHPTGSAASSRQGARKPFSWCRSVSSHVVYAGLSHPRRSARVGSCQPNLNVRGRSVDTQPPGRAVSRCRHLESLGRHRRRTVPAGMLIEPPNERAIAARGLGTSLLRLRCRRRCSACTRRCIRVVAAADLGRTGSHRRRRR